MIFDVGLLYAIVAYIAFLIAGLILNRTLATKYRETIDRPFCLMLIFFMAFTFVDGTWGIFFSDITQNDILEYEIFTYGFHTMAALSAFMWSGYMVKYNKFSKNSSRVAFILRLALLLSQLGILGANIFTGHAFAFPDGVYVPGPLRQVLFWLQFATYIIMTALEIFLIFATTNSEKRTTYRTAIIFSAIPLLAGFFQSLFPDAPMYSIGFLVSAVTIYSFNITSQRESHLAKLFADENDKLTSIASRLSGDYLVIFYVDMTTNTYELFGRDGKHYNDVGISENRSGDFFADLLSDMAYAVHKDDYALFSQSLEKEHILNELREKESFSFNYRRIADGDVRYYMVKVIRAKAENRVLIGAFDDDTRVREEMKQQEELRLAREAAESASLAKTKFLFNMSHDIRTPMNAILGFTDIAVKNIDSSDRALDALSKVRNAGDHLLSIINDVLDMSRIESGKVVLNIKPTSLSKCGNDVLDIVNTLAEEKQISLIHGESEVLHDMVMLDEMHVNRIFMNILSNAIKYTMPGGSVTYTIHEIPNGVPGVSVYEFVFRDTGIGMSEEFLSHIYETFSRERNSTVSGIQGTGLGMSITKSLVDLMHGTIHIDSVLGVGTTVTLRLPFQIAEAKTVSGVDGDAADPTLLRGKRILLVEDNELNREIATDILSDFGMIVDEADDGTAAVEKCARIAEADPSEFYDFVLMDIQMPTMDGYTATRKIREMADPRFASLPIVAMTANVFAEDVKRSLESGMNAHLDKPINQKTLIRVLTSFLK